MAVNALKIRLGAPDSMILFSGFSNQTDLGSSTGGVEINYNPTVLAVEIDQSILPVASYRTKEDLSFDVALAEIQMNRVALAFGSASQTASGIITTASGTLAAPAAPVPTVVGTPASTTYTYTWVAWSSGGDSIPSTAGTVATGPVTLSTTNYISIAAPATVTGAVGFKLIRTVGGTSQGLIQTFYGTPTAAFLDTGIAATAYTPIAVAPTYPNSDQTYVGGSLFVPNGPFDFSIPKNDGTTNHLRGHFNKVYSAKSTKIDSSRTKISELNKVSLMCLADLTQVVGRQGGYITEEYALLPLALVAGGTAMHQPVAALVGALGAIAFGAYRLWRSRRSAAR